jgi:hypothetical protein
LPLAQHEFGLDVIALTGVLRHRYYRNVPELHQALREQGVMIAEQSATNPRDRYDELLATSLIDSDRLRRRLAPQGRVILALDGLQPDVGHEVLWVIREYLSGEVLLARSLLSGTAKAGFTPPSATPICSKMSPMPNRSRALLPGLR